MKVILLGLDWHDRYKKKKNQRKKTNDKEKKYRCVNPKST